MKKVQGKLIAFSLIRFEITYLALDKQAIAIGQFRFGGSSAQSVFTNTNKNGTSNKWKSIFRIYIFKTDSQ